MVKRKIQIVYEDKALIIINKPPGVVVNRAETAKQETIQDWVEDKLKIPFLDTATRNSRDQKLEEEFVRRSGIIHRLDKETSGLLMIAKSPEAFEFYQKQFKSREIVKKYYALVHGRVSPPQGVINAPIGRNPFNREKFGVFPGGREAVTKYRVIKYIKTPLMASLLDITPQTGRTHQIRVHLAHLSHPVVSDNKYAGRKQLREDVKQCPRMFLHAYYLKFALINGKPQEVQIPLAEDLKKTLKTGETKP